MLGTVLPAGEEPEGLVTVLEAAPSTAVWRTTVVDGS